MEKFIDLPGMPDNILYDGEGHYWIGLATVIIHYSPFSLSNNNSICLLKLTYEQRKLCYRLLIYN